MKHLPWGQGLVVKKKKKINYISSCVFKQFSPLLSQSNTVVWLQFCYSFLLTIIPPVQYI